MSLPLEGIVVADFSRILAGPLATMFLGDLGADVIKVERPGVGDDARAWGPPFVGDDSAYYLAVNRNKRSVALDLHDEDDLKAALALADRADVLVENFRPGTMDRFGMGYPDLSGRNEGLVYCSISGFGTGAGAAIPAYDFVVQAAGGLMSLTGAEDGPPTKVGVALVDVLAGLHATIGIMAALHERDRSGLGDRVEVNLLSSLLGSLANQASSYLTAGTLPRAMGNRHPSIAPYQTLRVGDRLLALAVGNDRQFARLAEVLDRPDLARDDRFATNAARVANRTELVTRLEEVLAGWRLEDVVAALTAAGIPAGPVNDLAEAFRFAEELGLAPSFRMPAPGAEIGQVANPVRLANSAPSYRRPPPRLGEHTEEILTWLRA